MAGSVFKQLSNGLRPAEGAQIGFGWRWAYNVENAPGTTRQSEPLPKVNIRRSVKRIAALARRNGDAH
jgi:hypothetical protein